MAVMVLNTTRITRSINLLSSGPFSFRSAACAGLLPALLIIPSLPALASDWKITPSVSASETYTDNVNLGTNGKQSDWVTQISPGVSISKSGKRLKLNANYAFQNLFYASDNSRDGYNHQLNANGNAELFEKSLFVDANASIRQQATSLLAPSGTNNINSSNNLSTVRTLSLSPYLIHQFGSFASANMRYGHDETSSNAVGFSRSSSDTATLSLASGPSFNDLSWGLHFSDQKTKSAGRSNNIDSTTVSGNLGYRISPKFRVFATSGYEKSNYLYLGSEPKSSFQSVGFGWAPTTRTNIEASYGKRYFGKTYSLNLTHRTRIATFNALYGQDVTTSSEQLLSPDYRIFDAKYKSAIPDDNTRQQFVKNLLSFLGVSDTVLTNRVFLSKRLLATVTATGGKSTLTLSAIHSIREALESGTLDSVFLGSGTFQNENTVKQFGLNTTFQWKYSALTSSSFGAGWTRDTFVTSGRQDNLRYLGFGLSHKYTPKVTGSIDAQHQRRDSSQAGSDFRENSLSARVNMTF